MTYTINKEFVLGDNQGDSRVAQNMYIILHETANPKSTGRNEATYMHNNYQNAYTQFIVGDGLVYQVGAPGYVAWGALNGNPYSPVQIELQHTSDPVLFNKNYAIYIELARDMANKYGIPLSLDTGGAGTKGIKTHNWITQNYGGDHTDPYGYLASMGVSKAKLASDLASGVSGSSTPVAPANPDNRGSIDKFEVSNGKLFVKGWYISRSITHEYAYFFIMDSNTHKEIARYPLTFAKRPDVAKAYPNYTTPELSGFTISEDVSGALMNKNVYFKLRYTNEKNGDGNGTSDWDTTSYTIPPQGTQSSLDVWNQQGDNIVGHGWHTIMYGNSLPYRYAILMDANTNKELERLVIKPVARPDVAKLFPTYTHPETSGFHVMFNTKKYKGKKVFLITRYASKNTGEGIVIDRRFNGNTFTVK